VTIDRSPPIIWGRTVSPKTVLHPKTVLYLIVVVNSQVGACLVGLCHQGWRPLAEEPHRALREVERFTRNPEKLANADGRCWKDTLGRKRSCKTHRPPYPTRRGLVTAWQETKKLLHDESGWTMSGRNWRRKISKNYQDW